MDKVNIVVYNSQPCYYLNFFSFVQRYDAGHILAWLNETLAAFEARGEIAIIASHIPAATEECIQSWSVRYKAIVDRYQHIIRFSVYGHLHAEWHNLARSFTDDKPIGVSFWASSVTPYLDVNPSFRVFEVDQETMIPLKVHTYALFLNESEPQWRHSHEMAQYYGMKDNSPASYDDLSDKLLANETLSMLLLNQ